MNLACSIVGRFARREVMKQQLAAKLVIRTSTNHVYFAWVASAYSMPILWRTGMPEHLANVSCMPTVLVA